MNKIQKIFWGLALCAGCAIALTGCDDSLDSSLPTSAVTVSLSGGEGLSLTSEKITFRNVSTGRTSEFNSTSGISLLPGLYDVSYTATYNLDNGNEATLRAAKTSVTVPEGQFSLQLEGYGNMETDDLIIAEVFFSGTTRSSGNSYNGDDYIKLYNNTDHVIYADGITLFESKFLTTQKLEHTPDIMATDVNVQALYTIPGSGKEHPVQPGEYLLLADTGIDHRVSNPWSFDLSHADFEWYDESTTPSAVDIDSPTVPNLDKWWCYTKSFWLLHNRGFKAFGIARIPVDRGTYLKDYKYDYDYTLVTIAGTFPMSASAYRMPNDWIVDIVNCSVASEYQWNVCTPALDSGWTHCGTIDKDKNRFFHSVRRKLLYVTEDGRAVLQDTNNSTDDFNPDCVASEIERQGTVMNLKGEKSTKQTYDGIVSM